MLFPSAAGTDRRHLYAATLFPTFVFSLSPDAPGTGARSGGRLSAIRCPLRKAGLTRAEPEPMPESTRSLASLPDSPGTGAARDGRCRRTAGGGSVPPSEDADLHGAEPEMPEPAPSPERLPNASARERPQGAGSGGLLGPVRCVRLTLAAFGVGLRELVHRRPCVAGWVPTLGWAAGETRPSFGNSR